jgi:integrase
MKPSITPYTRHRNKCHHTDRHYHKCGCPIWFYDPSKPRGQQRYSAETNDWNDALQKASAQAKTSQPITRVTVDEAVLLYLVKRSKKLKSADSAPYKYRYMLRDGSKRQQSLMQWAHDEKFIHLDEVTHRSLDDWRNGWVFREKSYSLRVHNGIVKAFFEWALNFDYLVKNPYVKLDSIKVEEVPTLPLEREEYIRMLASVTVLSAVEQRSLTNHMLLMRWSGLAIIDASCLRRDALDKDNRLRTHRKKTGEYVYLKLPDFVADALRAQTCMHPDYFFWNKSQRCRVSQSNWFNRRLRLIYDAAGIFPRGGHRFRDTFAVEFLNSSGDISDLANLLGHRNTNVTQKHYMPWVKSRQVRLDAAVERSLAIQLPQQRLDLEGKQ